MQLTTPSGFRLRPGTPSYDAAWFEHHAGRVPVQWRRRLEKAYARTRAKVSEFAANTWLREISESLGALVLPLSAGDADVRAAADRLALECMRTAGESARDLDSYREAAERYVRGRGCRPPDVDDTRGAIARMTCPLWWRRQLRREHGRKIERHAIGFGYVHAKAEKYVSDVNVQRRQEQRRRNAATLAAVKVENQHGNEFTLAELAERSNACPRIRRAELMTRISGFEAVARGLGHVAEFWTLTCPSRFHARRAVDGAENPRYQAGTTPRDGQGHLSAAWARLRSFMQRRGVRWYGFRVAEPHHDGCPHWHVLLFMPAEAVATARKAARLYFLFRHDRREPGAYRNRVKFVSVEMSEARSAAGYIAKYISKNIDGYQVQRDLYGQDAVEGAQRIDAWAATWGIRQFQQLGGAPVGVWRELRRMRVADRMSDAMAGAIEAADAGDWAGYIRIQGGPMVDRKSLALVLAKTRPGERWCPVRGVPEPAPESRYGEQGGEVVWGVEDARRGAAFISRVFRWVVKGLKQGQPVPLDRAGARDRTEAWFAEAKAARRGFGVPWTRVNNCTRGVEDLSGPGPLPAFQMLAGDELEGWKRRPDVRPEVVSWWCGDGGASEVAPA